MTTHILVSDCINIFEGPNESSSSVMEDYDIDCLRTTSNITEDSSRANTQQTTFMPSAPNITPVIVAVICSIVVIIVLVILIITLLKLRKSSFKDKKNPNMSMQFKVSERSADGVVVCDSTSLNDEQAMNDGAPVYSVVSKHAKMISKEKAGKGDKEENHKMAVYYSTVCEKKELIIKSEVQNISDLYAAVDKSTRRKKKSPEEDKMAVQYSTVSSKEESNKKEVEDVSDLYAAVYKKAKRNEKIPEDTMAPVCNKEKPNSKSEVQNVSDLYAAVDKSAKRNKKLPEEIATLCATVDVMKKTI